MEFKGEDFIKKVQIKQEKEDLKQRLHDLEKEDNRLNQENIPNLKIDLNESLQEPKEELGDILLSQVDSSSDKKKYVVLGLILIVLFLITIIIIRLINNSDKQNDETLVTSLESKTIPEPLEENIEEQYQKIINDKIKKLQQERNTQYDEPTQKTQEIPNPPSEVKHVDQSFTTIKEKAIQTPEFKEQAITDKTSINKPTIPSTPPKQNRAANTWPIKKTTLEEPQEIDTEIEQEEIQFVKPKTSKKNTISPPIKKPSPSAVKKTGFFIQLGAFKTQPSGSYLEKIRKAGYSYILHRENVKGTLYTKLLVGPYSSRQSAQNELKGIQDQLGLGSLFIKKL